MNRNEQIVAAYAKYLGEHSVDYNNRQGAYVKIGLRNSDHTLIQLVPPFGRERKFCIFDYIGTCYTGIRMAKRVAKEMQARYPAYTVWAENYYDSFEIDIEQCFVFTTVEDLHQRVLRMVTVIDDCIPLGKEIAGEAFAR